MIRRRYRILGIALAVVGVAVAVGAFAVSYNSPCGAAEPVPAGVARMKAVMPATPAGNGAAVPHGELWLTANAPTATATPMTARTAPRIL